MKTFENWITVYFSFPQKKWVVRYKEVHLTWTFQVGSKTCFGFSNCPLKTYIGVFLWKFDRDSTSFTKKCLILQGVSYIACPLTVLALFAWKINRSTQRCNRNSHKRANLVLSLRFPKQLVTSWMTRCSFKEMFL